MKSVDILLDKIYRKMHWVLFSKCHIEKHRFLLYPSYRHYIKHRSQKQAENAEHLYLTAQPNKGAGIGHQIDGWIAGYLWAKRWKIPYAYSGFSDSEWDKKLGFGEHIVDAKMLLKQQGYKRRTLPYFDIGSKQEIEEVKNIAYSYAGEKTLLFLELDQFCCRQYEAAEDLQTIFNKAKARETDYELYSKDHFNIALHIRRGDIVGQGGEAKQEYQQRWLNDDYYVRILDDLLCMVPVEWSCRIYLFSQGEAEDFAKFQKYSNLKLCLELSAQDTFVLLTKADMLVTGKSSFSFDAALLSKGIKICPESFWGTYPQGQDWVLVEDEGCLTEVQKDILREQLWRKHDEKTLPRN